MFDIVAFDKPFTTGFFDACYGNTDVVSGWSTVAVSVKKTQFATTFSCYKPQVRGGTPTETVSNMSVNSR